MSDAGGGGAPVPRSSPGRESGFAWVSLHHNPGLSCRSPSRQRRGSLQAGRGQAGASLGSSLGGQEEEEKEVGAGATMPTSSQEEEEEEEEEGVGGAMPTSSQVQEEEERVGGTVPTSRRGQKKAVGGAVPTSRRAPEEEEERGSARPRGQGQACSAPPRGALLRWDEVPEELLECFILSGYRRLHCSARECLASALQPTNETLNFWTHFVPLLLFAGRFVRLLLLRGAGGLPFDHPLLLPLWCYASGVLLTLGMSCTAHLFSCLSLRLRATFFYLDYASISYYGFASTLAYYHYLLPGLRLLEPRALGAYLGAHLGRQVDPGGALALYGALVLPVAFALALTCTVACCKSRTDWCAHPAALRTFVFVLPLSMASPILLECLLFDLHARQPALCAHFYRRYLWLLVAAFFNVSKLPERIQPGLFDIVGHSHQLFHLCTFLSIRDQIFYVEEGLQGLLRAPLPAPAVPTLLGTVGYMLLLILCLGLVIRRFLNVPQLCKEA